MCLSNDIQLQLSNLGGPGMTAHASCADSIDDEILRFVDKLIDLRRDASNTGVSVRMPANLKVG